MSDPPPSSSPPSPAPASPASPQASSDNSSLFAQLLNRLDKLTKALEEKEKKGEDGSGSRGGRVRDLTGETDALEKINKRIKEVEEGYSGLYQGIDKHYRLKELYRQQEIEQLKKQLTALTELGEGHDQAKNDIEEQIAALGHMREAIQADSSAADQLAKAMQGALGLGQKADGLSYKLTSISKDLLHAKANGQGLGDVLKQTFKATLLRAPMKAVEMFVDQTFALIKQQDAAISSFRKATGATAEYNIGITQLERRNFAAGVSAADAGKSFEALFSTFSAFTQLNENQQAAVGDTTALLAKLGVSAQSSAKLFDTGMRSMGMSVGQTNDMILDLAGSAQTLGVSMGKMASDFAAASGELVKYGPRAVEVFKGLAIQAKNSGLEVSQLLKITKQFDQFDSAGKAVGRLNAILGGPYLNSIDMLNASEEERIDILKRSVDAAGVSFDALNRFEQQAIAASLGMNVEEANKLFRMSDEQYRLEAMKQEELQELARETQEIGKQLKSAFMALAVDLRPLIDSVVLPLIKGFAAVANWIGQGTNALGQFVKVGLFAAGIAALLAAPFTAGASLGVAAAIIGGSAAVAGIGAGSLAAAKAPADTHSGKITPRFANGGVVTAGGPEITPRFASGGVVTAGGPEITPRMANGGVVSGTSTAIVGEHGPELVEMPVGSRVTTAPATKQLTDAITKLSTKLDSVGGGPIQLAVYIGREKIDEIVVNALNSPAGKRTLSPYTS